MTFAEFHHLLAQLCLIHMSLPIPHNQDFSHHWFEARVSQHLFDLLEQLVKSIRIVSHENDSELRLTALCFRRHLALIRILGLVVLVAVNGMNDTRLG